MTAAGPQSVYPSVQVYQVKHGEHVVDSCARTYSLPGCHYDTTGSILSQGEHIVAIHLALCLKRQSMPQVSEGGCSVALRV